MYIYTYSLVYLFINFCADVCCGFVGLSFCGFNYLLVCSFDFLIVYLFTNNLLVGLYVYRFTCSMFGLSIDFYFH